MKLFALTAAVAHGVTLSCSSTGFDVVFTESDVYEDPSLLTSDQRFTEVIVGESATCRGPLADDDLDDSNENQVSFSQDEDFCTWFDLGISPVYDSEANQITYTVTAGVEQNPTVIDNGIEVMLTRKKNVELSCTYSALVNINNDNVFVDASELAAAQTFGLDPVSDSLDTYFTLGAFMDIDHTTPIDSDNKVTLGSTVFNQLSNTGLPDELDWFVESCHASSDSAGSVSVPLFDSFECANDLFKTEFKHSVNTAQTTPYEFEFQSFIFGSTAADSQVYLVCAVQICLAGEICGNRVTDCTDLGSQFTFNSSA